VLLTGNRRGAYNMAVDAALLKAVEEGKSPPVLRLYGWDPYCISLGYFQKPSQELNAKALEERGWDVVLRPTGGRAVLHAEELTYSVVARRDEAPWCATLALSHERISRAWAFALEGFDLNVSDGRNAGSSSGSQTVAGSSLKASGPGLPCFASTSRSELAFGKRKVVGSAQRRTREAFLQHGSIPLTPLHERLVEVLNLTEPGRADYLEALRGHATSLSEIAGLPSIVSSGTGASAGIQAWSRQLTEKLLEALEVQGLPGELTQEEVETAQALEKTHKRRQQAFFRVNIKATKAP